MTTPNPHREAGAQELYVALSHIRELLVAYGPRYIEKAVKLADAALVKAPESSISPNARLIAAAPELYEALSDAVELLQMAGFTPKAEHKAALAKARGEEA
jgi:hypothetical protein